MAKNSNLTAAKKAKNDEFYTQISDIEKELIHYWDKLKGKVVFCNCDDPAESNFWRYFHLNFARIGLKKLIATHYDPEKPTYKLEYEGGDDSDWSKGVLTPLRGNGDFRSPECVELLQSCDVVVTNPPFSLFREYVAQLVQYGKRFIIIGNVNAITYKEFFPLLKDNMVWIGPSITSGDRKFHVPDDYPLRASGCGVDPDGRKFIRVKGVRWFTNLDHKKRHEPLILFRRYADDSNAYPKYDNYDAINVNKVADIPEDYIATGLYRAEQMELAGVPKGEIDAYMLKWAKSVDSSAQLSSAQLSSGCSGIIGVPVTFLDKYCPEQFEILGLDRYIDGNPKPGKRFELGGHETYARILIRRKL